MEEQQHLVASRRAHRAHLTKITKKIIELQDGEIDDAHTATRRSCLEQLQRKRQILTELDNKIFGLIEDPDNLETDILEAEDIQSLISEKLCTTKSFIESKINTKSKEVHHGQPIIGNNVVTQVHPQPVQTTNAASYQGQGSMQPSTSQQAQQDQQSTPESTSVSDNLPAIPNTNVNVPMAMGTTFTSTTASIANNSYNSSRLPKLALPKFDGNPLNWQSFWDSYRTAVHDNPCLSNIQKLNYLRAQLYDEASKSIAGFPLTDANYLESIKLLQERFGQQHRVVSAHMQALLNITNPTNTLSSLRIFYDTLEIHIRGLEALGKSHETYGDILVPIIHKKLPTDLIKTLAREHDNNEWKLNELRKAIRREVEILEVGENNTNLNDLENTLPASPTAAFSTG